MDALLSPQDLSAQWLTEVLRARGAIENGHVQSFKLRSLNGAKGSFGQIVAIELEYDTREPFAPQQLVAKFAPPFPQARENAKALGFCEREVYFYRELASHFALRTPRCYYAAYDSETGACTLLLENLEGARNGDRAEGAKGWEVRLALQQAASLHAAWWEHPQIASNPLLAPLDPSYAQNAFNALWPHFVMQMESVLIDPLLRFGEELCSKLAGSLRRLSEPPWTLAHNDYQLDNLFFAGEPANPELIIADWQMSTRLRGAYDVGLFLSHCLSPIERRAQEKDLVRLYHEELVKHGVLGYSLDQCIEDYRLASFDGFFRLVFAIGGGELREEQDRVHREVLWPRAAAAVLDLDIAELL